MAVLPMLKKMIHRGPDFLATHNHKLFTMGFARLSIFGTKIPAAHQPHITRKGRVLTFNGELYNYRSLIGGARSEVEALGALLDEGYDPRQYLDGDYAICYFNPSQQEVTLYRDRFGVCPLYYDLRPYVSVSSEARRLYHAREVPAFGKVVIDLRTRTAERDQMKHYGLTIERKQNQVKVFKSLLHSAVMSRAAHSDGGFSLALSGGFDSSLIAFALASQWLEPESAVCVAMDPESEDARIAQQVARQCGFRFRLLVLKKDAIDAHRAKIIEHLDHREGRPVSAIKWRGAVRNYFAAGESPTKVMLSGEGADELLGGYPSHWSRATHPLSVAAKCLSTVRSMPAINLDRTNKLGMAHSVEYRCPYLESSLSMYMLSLPRERGKGIMRRLLDNYATRINIPTDLMRRGKYGREEDLLAKTLEG